MGLRTSTTTDASGRRVVAKVAGTTDEAARLENEAALLEAGRHPGVAELVGVDGHGVGAVLRTVQVDGSTVAHVGRLPLEEAAGLLAALATTLADLHDLGLVHGAVAPDHVLIGPEGRPVLCSLGYGGRVGEPRRSAPEIPPAFIDPARTRQDTLVPALDVFGLGALAGFLAPSPPPGHVLATVACDATSDDPAGRPTARAVAEVVQREVPAARLPRGLRSGVPDADRPAPARADPLEAWRRERGGTGRHASDRRPVGKVLAPVVGAVVVGAVLLALPRLASQPSPSAGLTDAAADPAQRPAGEAQPDPPTTRAGLASSATTTSVAVTSTPPPPAGAARPRDCPQVSAVLQADADGDGCPEPMRYADGILEGGGVRWALGQVGDQVATGDWGCQGARTVALFRPSTGEIFRFDGWASPGRDVPAEAVARVEGGRILRAADLDRDGCHEAVVERASGLPVEVIRLPRRRP